MLQGAVWSGNLSFERIVERNQRFMNKFKFFLVKYKNKRKNLVIEAKDSVEARQIIQTNYPSWDVSMFWIV